MMKKIRRFLKWARQNVANKMDMRCLKFEYLSKSVNERMFNYCYTYNIPFSFDGYQTLEVRINKEFSEEFLKRFEEDDWNDKKNIMRKFQFIRFGGKVQWVNDSTDTCRIMQVCTPTPKVITEDTIISLISADEDEYAEEEQSVSYAVRAGELTPFLTSYHDGFWRVMLAALESGSNASVARTILKCFSLSYEECMLLIQRFDLYKAELGAIINSHFKVNENVPKEERFQIEGNTYVPEVSVTEYNTDNGTCFEEVEVEFELQQ